MSRKKRLNRAARDLPAHMQDVAFTKFSAKAEKRRRLTGSFGAASPCKRIDPNTGEVIEIISGGIA